MAVAAGHGGRCPARSVTSSKVPSPRLRNRRSPGADRRIGWEGPALDGVNVEPAVAVVVEQADAAAAHLGELMDRRSAVIQDEGTPAGGRTPSSNEGIGPADRPACALEPGAAKLGAGPRSPARTWAKVWAVVSREAGRAVESGQGRSGLGVNRFLLLDQFPEPTRLEPTVQSVRQPRQLDQMIGETVEFL